MRWELKYGHNYEWFVSLVQEENQDNMTKEIKDVAIRALNAKPLLKDEVKDIFETFIFLWNGQIYLSDIKIYLETQGITDLEEIQDYIFYLKKLEKELLAHNNKPKKQVTTYGNSNNRNKHKNR